MGTIRPNVVRGRRGNRALWFGSVTFRQRELCHRTHFAREGCSTSDLPGARALGSSLVRVHLAMLHHLSFGLEFSTASAALVFFPE